MHTTVLTLWYGTFCRCNGVEHRQDLWITKRLSDFVITEA